MRDGLSPKQVAQALGVSEASVKRWCDRGFIENERTAGGHRRLAASAVIKFVRKSGSIVTRPEILGLPEPGLDPAVPIAEAAPVATQALESGDMARLERLLFNLFLKGHPLAEIGDHVIAKAFHAIGERWEHKDIEVYVEHRAVEICTRVLHHMARSIGPAADDAPLAIGGTPAGDPYTIVSTLVELTLRELGWRAEFFGPDHPIDTAIAAIDKESPRLMWLSVSSIGDTAQFLADYRRLQKKASERGTAILVGGRALTDAVRREMTYSAFCDNLQHVVTFATTIYRRPEPVPGRSGAVTAV